MEQDLLGRRIHRYRGKSLRQKQINYYRLLWNLACTLVR